MNDLPSTGLPLEYGGAPIQCAAIDQMESDQLSTEKYGNPICTPKQSTSLPSDKRRSRTGGMAGANASGLINL